MRQGFTLIELGIVFIILGLLTGTGLVSVGSLVYNDQLEDTEDRLDAIEDAIVMFYTYHGFLPCPASRSAAVDDSAYGTMADCAASDSGTGTVSSNSTRTGAVPIRELQIGRRFMIDGWNSRFTYVVTEALASGPTESTNYNNTSSGNLTIQDADGNDVTASSGIGAYVLFSHGDDRKGAYPKEGSAITVNCGTSGNIVDENCEGDGAGTRDTTYIDAEYNPEASGSSYFDDIVRWKTRSRMPITSNVYPFVGIQSGSSAYNSTSTMTALNLKGGNYIDTRYKGIPLLYDSGADSNTVFTVPYGIRLLKMTFSGTRYSGDPECAYEINGTQYTFLDSVSDLKEFHMERILKVEGGDEIQLVCAYIRSVSFRLEAMNIPFLLY